MPTCPFCSREVPAASSICPHCLRALPISVTTARPAPTRRSAAAVLGWMRPALFVCALFAVGGYALHAFRHRQSKSAVAAMPVAEGAPRTGPVTTTIAPPLELPIADSASVPLAAGGHLAYTFSGEGRAGCRLHGVVQALAGGDRRFSVFVVDRDGLADVEGGRTPRTYYDSGVVTDVSLDISLDGRSEYTLVVANAGKAARAKSVRLKGVGASCMD